MGRNLGVALCAGLVISCSGGRSDPPLADAGASLTLAEARKVLRNEPLLTVATTANPSKPVGPATFRVPAPITADGDRFVARRRGASAFFTPRGLSFSLRGGSKDAPKAWGLHASLVGAREVAPVGEQVQRAKVNQFVGAPAAWKTSQETYGQVAWEEVYPGVDMVASAAAGGFAYRFVLSPGAKVEDVALRWDGARAVRAVDAGHAVEVETGLGVLHVSGLHAFSVAGAQRRELPARFVVREHTVTMEVDGWDGKSQLLIDPTIAWGSYLGGSGFEGRGPIAVDGAGNAYVSGDVSSSDFPATVGDLTVGGSQDAFVAKVSSAGTLLWATYLGGGNWEGAGGIATEPGGTNVYVAGYTQSSDFPATAGLDTSLGGSRDGFLTKLTMAGGLVVWSTYLGGTSDDVAKAVTVSAGLDVFVTGYTGSTNFPTTGGFDTTLGGAQDAFVTRFASTGSIAFSSYLGGAGSETGTGIAVDAAGNAFVTGNTDSTDFPTGSGFDTTLGGGQDAFVTKVATAGTLTWSSYLGGSSGDSASGIAADGSGNVVVVGTTGSSDFPTTGGFDTSFGGSSDAYATKISGAGAILWSSYLGGSDSDNGNGVAIGGGDVYVTGYTYSPDFPAGGGFDASLGTLGSDALVAKISGAGALLWSSYLGGSNGDIATGIVVDASGNVYVTGETNSNDFPTPGGFDTTRGGTDCFVTKLAPATVAVGGSCTSDGACTSGHCADGVCCDTACKGVCVACTAAKRGTGTDGTCGPIADATDPDLECPAQSCTAGVVTKVNVCNGSGACRGTGTTSCGLFACSGTTCGTTCADDTSCLPGAFCSGTTCTTDLPAGGACTRAAQCASGFCVDSVCCDKACGGGCEACSAAKKGKGTDGTCEPVVAGSDPRDSCTADAAYPTSCKADGMCDGAGACRVNAVSGTPCGASTCAAGVVSGKTCNGAGGCDATPKSCGDYTCADTSVCRASCTADTDCAATAYCTAASTCAPKNKPGTACTAGKECEGGNCVDGVCCDKACDGQCEACDVAGALGTCKPVTGKVHGTKRPACADDGNGCAGACDGTSVIACLYPDAKTSCGAGCASNKLSVCDGKGACGAAASCPDNLICADAKSCKAKCTVKEDCVSGNVCDTASGRCVPARSSCSTDNASSVPPEGAAKPCGAYLCNRSTGDCYGSCTGSEQCAAGFACDEGKCLPVPAVAEDGGCNAGGRPSSAFVAVFGLLALGLVRRRRGA